MKNYTVHFQDFDNVFFIPWITWCLDFRVPIIEHF